MVVAGDGNDTNKRKRKRRGQGERNLLDIQLAVAQSTKREFALRNRVAKVDAQHGNAIDDGRRDVGNDEQHRSSQQEEGADVVDKLADAHDDGSESGFGGYRVTC